MELATAPDPPVAALSAWLAGRPEMPPPPYDIGTVTGGRTHRTYRATGRDGRSVLVRRPSRDEADSPADRREHRIVTALAEHGAPVARPLARCEDATVLGAPFSVVTWVDGLCLGDADAAGRVPPAVRAAAGPSFAATLARVHAVDLADAGLADLSRPTTYVDRQVRAWRGQALLALDTGPLERDTAAGLADDLDRLADQLVADQPPPERDVLLHGDYRLDNVLLTGTGEVLAVVDWELAATGDPLCDLGYAALMWDPFDSLGRSAPTSVAGFCSSAELCAHYAAAVGRPIDPDRLAFHLGFAAWRAACIGAVVVGRHADGAEAGTPVDASRGAAYVTHYRDRCRAALNSSASRRATRGRA